METFLTSSVQQCLYMYKELHYISCMSGFLYYLQCYDGLNVDKLSYDYKYHVYKNLIHHILF